VTTIPPDNRRRGKDELGKLKKFLEEPLLMISRIQVDLHWRPGFPVLLF
jgi:hypothetical protein